MVRLGNNLIKLLLGSLLIGLVLGELGITADSIFSELGVDPEAVHKSVGDFMRFVIPPMATGALIAIPVWVAMMFFRSPQE